MRNANLAFEILTQSSSLEHNQFLVFQTPSEMSIKGLKLRYAKFITSLSALQVAVDINYIVQNVAKRESRELLLQFRVDSISTSQILGDLQSSIVK